VIASEQRIDWGWFLARPPLALSLPEALDALSETPILITGAGSSIGSALAEDRTPRVFA